MSSSSQRYKRRRYARKALLAVTALVMIGSVVSLYLCTNESDARQALVKRGYTDVESVDDGFSVLSGNKVFFFASDAKCSPGNVAVYTFRAVNPDTKKKEEVKVCASAGLMSEIAQKQ